MRLNVQNSCFVDRISAYLPASLYPDLREAFSVASLQRNVRTVILVDVLHADLREIVSNARSDSVYVALVNVNRHHDNVTEYVQCGVRGLFFDDEPPASVEKGVRALAEGHVWISRETLYDVAVGSSNTRRSYGDTDSLGAMHTLTRREREIIALICLGATNQEIADKLYISPNTVKTHVYKIFKKIGVPNRMQAALWGAQNL